MIIVNQNKDRIINFNNVDNINIEKCYNESLNEEDVTFDIYAFIVSSGLVRLGKYKTEGRSKEVLQLILENYNYITRALADMNGGNRRMFTCYFEMPQE